MRILFIITSSIAAVKCEEIMKELIKKSVQIDCILTEKTKKILNYKKLKNMTNINIYTDKSEKNNKMLHIELSRKTNLILVCPATANTIAKYANGLADNLASTTLLAANKKIIFVPAMNKEMWNNKMNQKNIKFLNDIGIEFIGPKYGKLFCGEKGLGRLASTKFIIQNIMGYMNQNILLKGKNCLVTAGPTQEKIDPVRFISNFSSGKQGYEIANQLALSGGRVTLISGPTKLNVSNKIKLINIKTAQEMLEQVKKLKNIDIAIFAAAVCDFKINKIKEQKIQKKNFTKINLKKNIDILKFIANRKKNKPKVLVGFAAETKSINLAKKKLLDKNCDLIIYNKINKNNKIFDSDYNKISIISKNKIIKYPKMSKVNCAKKIINSINKIL